MKPSHRPLDNREIVIMRSLMMRGASATPVTVPRWQREPAIPLWRRGLIFVWFRHLPGEYPRGPFFTLSIIGAQIASSFLPAPRGSSGALEKSQ